MSMRIQPRRRGISKTISGVSLGFLGTALERPPWRAERAHGGAATGGPSAYPRKSHEPSRVSVYASASSS
eukprot:7712386-Pyramimonas_sp.AAC.1